MDHSTTTIERVDPSDQLEATFSSFSTNQLPDLSFSFEPKGSYLDQRVEGKQRDKIGSDGEVRAEGDFENPFELGAREEEEEDSGEGNGDDEIEEGDCQVIEAKREVLERKKLEGEVKIERMVEIGSKNGVDDSKGEDAAIGYRSSSTRPDSFIDPLQFRQSRAPETMIPPLPSFSSPPRHDVTGRLLPSEPPPLLPFDIIPSTPPRSPRSRFGSSTKSFKHRFSQRLKGSEEDTFHGSDTYWDSTIEMDSFPSTPRSASFNSKSKSNAIPLPSPLPFPSSPRTSKVPVLIPPPRSHSPTPPRSPIRQPLATRRNSALPSPFLRLEEGTSNLLSPSSSPLLPPSPSLRRIERSTSGYYRLPPSSPSYDFPPPISATSSHFPFPPQHSSDSFTPTTPTLLTNPFPQTPSTTASYSFFPSSPQEREREQERESETPLPMPKFVSVFIDPSNNNCPSISRDEKELPHSSVSRPPHYVNETKHRRSSTLRHRNVLLNVGSGQMGLEELPVGNLGGKEKEREGEGKVEKWLKNVSRNDERSFSSSNRAPSITRGEFSAFRERDGRGRGKIRFEGLRRFARTKKGKWMSIAGTILIAVLSLGIIVGVIKSKKDNQTSCPYGVCSLNSTCINLGGNPIAQAFVDLANVSSSTWNPPIDPIRLAYTLNHCVSPPSLASTSHSTSPCSSQLSLLSIPSLSSFPNRSTFSRLALVHTLALTESNSTTFRLYKFISSLSFKTDEPSSLPNSNYQLISGGFTWDFSTMQRTVQNVKWRDLVKPEEEELRVGESSTKGLDKITPYAVAGNSQRSLALMNYWIDTLARKEDELDSFRTVVKNSEILIPFDQDVRTIQGLVARKNDSLDIVEGIGCRGDLSQEVRDRINAVENRVFDLPNQSCFARPIYGVLNLFHLSTPFPPTLLSSRPALPQNSLVLSQDVSNRIAFHAGEILSAGSFALPPLSSSLKLSAPVTIERFGLLNQIDHVLLDYLNLLDVETANLVIDFLLLNSSNPPSSSSALVSRTNRLSTLPIMEAVLWGGVKWNDVKEVRSGNQEMSLSLIMT
ncbi:hypothetical protein JCM3765_004573 [Sporobolomyces pararoseus]